VSSFFVILLKLLYLELGLSPSVIMIASVLHNCINYALKLNLLAIVEQDLTMHSLFFNLRKSRRSIKSSSVHEQNLILLCLLVALNAKYAE
jgi:hypothetical protein